ncbi:MAG: hypothetical protein AB7O28_19820 [Vicinamibacterales bacterium]
MALRNRRLAQLALFLALAVLHTWPLAAGLSTWSRMDNADTALNAWILAWDAHQLPIAPLHLFDANIFYPEPRTLAFSEHMVVQGVMGLPLFAAGLSAVTVYNVLAILGFATSGLAMAIVVERWTGHPRAGVVAGMAYAFNAHTLVRFGHMQALHVQFLPFALAALHDLADRPAWRTAWRMAAATTLQALTSNYLLVMTAVAMAASAAARPTAWLGPDGRRRLWMTLAAAAAASAAVVPFLLPYYFARERQGLLRPFEEVAYYSGQWRDYLATGGRLHYALWSHRWFDGATPLFPGLAVALLAAYALAAPETWRDGRARAMVVVGALGMALSFGASLPGYRWLYDHVAILQGIRAVVRLGWLWLVALAVLAGLGLARLERRHPRHALALAAAAGLAVTLEAARTPVPYTRFDGIPPIYTHVAALVNPVLIEVPFPAPGVIQQNGPYVLASTTHFHDMLNGYSGFMPASYALHAAVARRLPSASAVEELGILGATHLVVHGRLVGADAVAQLEATGRVRRLAVEGDDRLYAIVMPPP